MPTALSQARLALTGRPGLIIDTRSNDAQDQPLFNTRNSHYVLPEERKSQSSKTKQSAASALRPCDTSRTRQLRQPWPARQLPRWRKTPSACCHVGIVSTRIASDIGCSERLGVRCADRRPMVLIECLRSCSDCPCSAVWSVPLLNNHTPHENAAMCLAGSGINTPLS